MSTETLPASFTCSNVEPLPPAQEGWFAVDYAPLCDGSLACLQATKDIRSIVRTNREPEEAAFEKYGASIGSGSEQGWVTC